MRFGGWVDGDEVVNARVFVGCVGELSGSVVEGFDLEERRGRRKEGQREKSDEATEEETSETHDAPLLLCRVVDHLLLRMIVQERSEDSSHLGSVFSMRFDDGRDSGDH